MKRRFRIRFLIGSGVRIRGSVRSNFRISGPSRNGPRTAITLLCSAPGSEYSRDRPLRFPMPVPIASPVPRIRGSFNRGRGMKSLQTRPLSPRSSCPRCLPSRRLWPALMRHMATIETFVADAVRVRSRGKLRRLQSHTRLGLNCSRYQTRNVNHPAADALS